MRFASTLLTHGAKSVLVTLGARGVLLVRAGASQAECVEFAALRPARIKSVTGAGDSLVGGIVVGLSLGRTLEQSIPIGLIAARLCIEGEATVSQAITPATLFAADLPATASVA